MVRFFSSRRFLAIYSGVLTLVFAVTVLSGFSRSLSRSASFDQITVRRMNVVEPDGTVRLVISDRDEFPGLFLHGKDIKRSDRKDSAGMLFINDEGTEDGGLIYGGSKYGSDRSSKGPSSFSHLSFDQYDQDQTLVLGSSFDGGKRASFMQINDAGSFSITPEYLADVEQWKTMAHGIARAEAWAKLKQKYPPGAERGFFGRQTDNSVGLSLSDVQGHQRIALTVKPDGEPVLQFLDADGKVTREITGNK